MDKIAKIVTITSLLISGTLSALFAGLLIWALLPGQAEPPQAALQRYAEEFVAICEERHLGRRQMEREPISSLQSDLIARCVADLNEKTVEGVLTRGILEVAR